MHDQPEGGVSRGHRHLQGGWHGWTYNGATKLLDKANNTSILITSAGMTDYFLAKFSPKGDVLWAKSFGDATDNGGDIHVAVDANGNVGIAGAVSGAIDFGSGPVAAVGGGSDIFAVMYDAQGIHLWTKRFANGSSANAAEAIAFDAANNMLIGGRYSGALTVGTTMLPSINGSDAMVIKLAGMTGTVTWAKQFTEPVGQPSGKQKIHALTTDGSNNIYITGEFSGSIFISSFHVAAGGSDVFVAKLDSNGTAVWDRAFGSTGNDVGSDVAIDSSGSVLVTGTLIGAGGFDLGGGLGAAQSGISHTFLAKYTNSGVYSHANIFSHTGNSSGISVTTDQTDNVYLTGLTTVSLDLGGGFLTGAGNADIFSGEFDSNLNPI